MAKAKRKTLPKNFRELIEAGDIDALKAVFISCDIAAYQGYSKESALHLYDIPEELVRWLVAEGLDVDTPDGTYGKTPLYVHAGVGSRLVPVLLDLGADVNKANKYGETPLHAASRGCRVDTVRALLASGANVNAKDSQNHMTPLSEMLVTCSNSNIACCAQTAAILLDAGASITSDMQESVRKIGERFEFHRENFNKDYLAETEAGLKQLYGLFDVEPIASRRIHDGVSEIALVSGTWQKQHAALWDYLVPSQGAAQTAQSEVIRITGRISDELYRNGGANWDSDYHRMLGALPERFSSGEALSIGELEEVTTLASSKTLLSDEDADRLCELAVKWVGRNPIPFALGKTKYRR